MQLGSKDVIRLENLWPVEIKNFNLVNVFENQCLNRKIRVTILIFHLYIST